MDMDDKYKGTGRTTRMLERVRDEAKDGYTVYVVGMNYAHCKLLQLTFGKLTNGARQDWAKQVVFVSDHEHSRMRWELDSRRRRGERITIHIDHAVFDMYMGRLLAQRAKPRGDL